MIHRRHALGLLAAAGLLPSRSFANVAPQRSEVHAELAKHFTDIGTVGTFVGYKVDDYLIIATTRTAPASRSCRPPPSRSRIR